MKLKKTGVLIFIFEMADYMYQKNRGESGGRTSKERNSIYQNETAEPCYFSSSIHYGGQEVYSPAAQGTNSQYTVREPKKKEPFLLCTKSKFTLWLFFISYSSVFLTWNQIRKDGSEDDLNGNNSASRGNWWQGKRFSSFLQLPYHYFLWWKSSENLIFRFVFFYRISVLLKLWIVWRTLE